MLRTARVAEIIEIFVLIDFNMQKINDRILEINYLKSNQNLEYPILKLYHCLYRIAIKIIQISWKISLRVYKIYKCVSDCKFSRIFMHLWKNWRYKDICVMCTECCTRCDNNKQKYLNRTAINIIQASCKISLRAYKIVCAY